MEINIRPGFLDEIDLYDPLAGDTPTQAPSRSVGDRFSWLNNARPTFTYNFSVPVGDVPRDILLQVRTSSSRLIDVTALTPPEAQENDRNILTIVNFVLFSLCAFLAWAIYNWVTHRERLSAAFVMLQLASIAFGFNLLGYARVYLSGSLSPEFLDTLTSFSVIGYSYISIWFYITFISEYSIKPWVRNLLRSLLDSGAIVVAIYLFVAEWLGLMLNVYVAMITCIILFLCSLFGIAWHNLPPKPTLLPKKILVSYFFVLALINSLHGLSILGFTDSYHVTFYGGIYNGLLTGLLLTIVLHVRSKNIDLDQKQRIAIEASKAESEREQREQQGQFVDMLAHELKTPLSIISLAVGSEEPSQKLRGLASNAVTSMKDVVTRCIQSAKLSDQGHPLNCAPLDLQILTTALIQEHPASERIKLHTHFDGTVHADKELIGIVISNLLDNAIKYGDKQGIVDIELMKAEDSNTITLSVFNDIGPTGIPDPQRLFQKYYRSPKAQHATGSGLGLHLSRMLVQMHRGNLRYEIVGDRVCFRMNLPLMH